ncbi:MAG TPA: DUF2752 domain-containing protein [Cellulomonas sp.]
MTAPDDDPPVARATPAPVAARLRAARDPLLVAGVAVVGAIALLAVDPHIPGSWGACPLYALTGRYCAACGGLRATHDLLVGDLAGAWGMNPLWVLAVPLLLVVWVRWTTGALRTGRPGRLPGTRWAVGTGVLLLAYGAARNVPALAPWLAP